MRKHSKASGIAEVSKGTWTWLAPLHPEGLVVSKQGIGVLRDNLRAGTSQRDACLPSCSLPVLTGVHIPAELSRVI